MGSLMVFNNEKFGDIRGLSIDGEPYFVGKDIASKLGYARPTKAIQDKVDDEDIREVPIQDSIGRMQNTPIINESGLFSLVLGSKLDGAKQFKRWITKEVLPTIRKTGKFDSKENSIMQIEDEKERNLKLKLYKIGDILKTTPEDMLMTINYNNTKQELTSYMQGKELKKVASNVDEINNRINKATVLREGDMSAKAIATKFNIFSPSNKPHPLFADNIARDLGFYINPTGNAGYQDNFVSINLTTIAGKTVPEIKYSESAVTNMEKSINENGLNFVEYELYKRGSKKGTFKNVRIKFENGQEINVNETTYNLYTKNNLN